MALRPISRLETFEFPSGTWDVRGWTVRTASDDRKVGQVEDMLLGADGQLSYLEVDLGFMKKHVLVPLDRARADREGEVVWVKGVSKERLEEAPEYVMEPETLDESYERRLHAYYGGEVPRTAPMAGREGSRSSELEARAAPTAPAPAEPGELRRMADLEKEYEVGGDDPRGWKVVTGEGETVGRVAELLVATGEMKARYLDVAVDEKSLALEPVDRHVLLPSQRVRLDHGSKKVVVAGLFASDLAEFPQYGGLPLKQGHVQEIDEFFERAGTGATASASERVRPASDSVHAPARHFYGSGSAADDDLRAREE
jgi:hypothetical protein